MSLSYKQADRIIKKYTPDGKYLKNTFYREKNKTYKISQLSKHKINDRECIVIAQLVDIENGKQYIGTKLFSSLAKEMNIDFSIEDYSSKESGKN